MFLIGRWLFQLVIQGPRLLLLGELSSSVCGSCHYAHPQEADGRRKDTEQRIIKAFVSRLWKRSHVTSVHISVTRTQFQGPAGLHGVPGSSVQVTHTGCRGIEQQILLQGCSRQVSLMVMLEDLGERRHRDRAGGAHCEGTNGGG